MTKTQPPRPHVTGQSDPKSFFQAISQEYESESQIGVFCLVFDRFQRMNENLGHKAANLLFAQATRRLNKLVSRYGKLFHLNGFEFCIILKPLPNKKAIADIAQEILQAFSRTFSVTHGQETFVSVSIGISVYVRDGFDFEALLKNAHTAMLRVNKQGGNLSMFYSMAFNVGLSNFTSLLRWFHPTHGLISPRQFIPLAEETGLIIPIGEFVLQKACQQLRQWKMAGLQDFTLSVNLSARQFTQLDLHQRLSQILIEHQLKPQDIELELTESTLVGHGDASIRRLKALKTLGVQISLDDFGTGYSGLSYLQHACFDTVKIDRSFINKIHSNPVNGVIIKAIITMAHKLNLKVIAEGVESQEELEFLKQFNCDEIQGFVFSRPIQAAEFERSPFMANAFERLFHNDKSLVLAA
ncbi:sensory box/GGDEF family protein [[Synechococcus] sp. NIES-970]|nr:sensory box/GGDEF family protein [[Synechococcus] sp. NIES-970]